MRLKYKELEYGRTFNRGNFESEKITVKMDLDETDDLDESYMTAKADLFRLQEQGNLIEDSKKAVEIAKKLEPIQNNFPANLRQLIIFNDSMDATIIKPRSFLGSENFAKIAAIVHNLNGKYVSAGKSSHFRIPKK